MSNDNLQKELEELQELLYHIDRNDPNNYENFIKVLIKRIKDIKVKMYQENHNLPHIHIDYNNKKHDASYSIITGEILSGNSNKLYDKTIKDWILKNQNILIEIWNALQKGDKSVYEELISGKL